jgi:hypothetical protein
VQATSPLAGRWAPAGVPAPGLRSASKGVLKLGGLPAATTKPANALTPGDKGSHENGNTQHKRYHDGVDPVAGAASIRVGSVLSAVGAVTALGTHEEPERPMTAEDDGSHGGWAPIYSRAEHKRSHAIARENAFLRSIPRRPLLQFWSRCR